MKPTLLVLAAGSGSRYGSLKQFDAVGPNGETIMDYSVYDAIRAGFGKVVFVIRETFAEKFKRSVGSRYAPHLPVSYVSQELLSYAPPDFSLPKERHKPWGTGHAVLVAEREINEPFAMVNADDFYGQESFQLIADFLKRDGVQESVVDEYAMVGFLLKNTLSVHGTVSRGVCDVEADYLASVVEFPRITLRNGKIIYIDDLDEPYPLSGDEVVSMNMWGFTPSIFGHLRHQFLEFLHGRALEEGAEFFIPTVVNTVMAAREARVRVLRSEANWFGMTYKQDLVPVQKSIRRLIDSGQYPEKLWS